MLGKTRIVTSVDLLTFDGWINFFQVIYICSTQLNTSMTSLSFLLLLHKVLDAVYSGSCPDHSQRPLIRWSVRDCELIGKLPGWSDGIWEVRRPANLLIAKSAEFLRLLPSRSTKFLPNFFGHTIFNNVLLPCRTLPPPESAPDDHIWSVRWDWW